MRKYKLEIYVLIISLITLLGWYFSTIVGIGILLLLSIIVLFIFRDFKYIIPQALSFIFVINKRFSNQEVPLDLVVLGGIFIVFSVIFAFKDGIKITKMKSVIGLIGLAVTNLVPILWANVDYNIFYVFFFADFLYLILYLIFVNGIKKDSINMLSVSLSYVAVVIALECIIKVFGYIGTVNSIFSIWYHLGWGLCNEAGILMCVGLPYIFYLLYKADDFKMSMIQLLKLGIVIIGLVMTMSRGTYLIGLVELVLLFSYYIYKNSRSFIRIFLPISIIGSVILVFLFLNIENITNLVFRLGLSSNGRISIWLKGDEIWHSSLRNLVFGAGFCASVESLKTSIGYQEVPLVFHSTITQTCVMGGIVGLVFLVIHLVEKYKNLFYMDKFFCGVSLIGYVMVDIYGLLDNSYHMYYYMVILVIIMASIDSSFEKSYDLSLSS